MNVTRKGSDIIIDGNIKTTSDFQAIKALVDTLMARNMPLHIVVSDSISMTSSVIGYFTKLVLKDNVQLSLSIGNAELRALLEELGVHELLHVRSLG